MGIDVSVIIVSYNTKDLTRNCLNSLYEKTQGVNFDVFVVDNDSQDGSCEMIKTEFPQVKLIESKENLGFGRANNLAIKQSNAEYVFLLNTDTLLINNAIKIMLDFLNDPNNKEVGACGGNLYDIENKNALSYGYLPTIKTKFVKTFQLKWLFPSENTKISDKGFNVKNELKQVDYITGADLMMRKSVLDQVGIFDEDFFLYYEETELQYRINKAGYKIFILPDAKINHLEGKSSSNRKNRRKVFLESEYLFYKKCYGITKYSPLKLIFFVSSFLRLFSRPKMILNLYKFILAN